MRWSFVPYAVWCLIITIWYGIRRSVLVGCFGIECRTHVVWSWVGCLILAIWSSMGFPFLAMWSTIGRRVMCDGIDGNLLKVVRLLHIVVARWKSVVNASDEEGYKDVINYT